MYGGFRIIQEYLVGGSGAYLRKSVARLVKLGRGAIEAMYSALISKTSIDSYKSRGMYLRRFPVSTDGSRSVRGEATSSANLDAMSWEMSSGVNISHRS